MDVRVPRDAQVRRLRELGPEGRIALGCQLIAIGRELSKGQRASSDATA